MAKGEHAARKKPGTRSPSKASPKKRPVGDDELGQVSGGREKVTLGGASKKIVR